MASDSYLSGRSIAVTRAETQLGEARRLFEAAGATVVDLPALVVTPPDEWGPLDDALAELDDFHWLVFSSGNGVEAVEQRLRRIGRSLAKLRLVYQQELGDGTPRRFGQRPGRGEGLLCDAPEHAGSGAGEPAHKPPKPSRRWPPAWSGRGP
jgi:hypothetical protein